MPGNEVPFVDLKACVNEEVRATIEAAWKTVLAHAKFVDGPEVRQFEAEFALYCRVAECVGVANGTDALELILTALGIGRGDEVIVPGNTFVATAEAVCNVGARPCFVDVQPDTLLMNSAAVEAAVTANTAGIILVHLFGQMVASDRILSMAKRRGIAVVEDAAQAHGAMYAGRRAGSIGVAAAFSFYPAKNLGAFGDAGAVVSNDPQLIAKIRSIANHGRAASGHNLHERRGRNSRLSSIQAAVLLAKLRTLDIDNLRRSKAMDCYRSHLPPSCRPLAVNADAMHVYHLAVVRATNRLTAINALDKEGIGWGIHYPVPCHRQPAFSKQPPVSLPAIESAATQILSLPMYPSLAESQIVRVCEVLSRAERGRTRAGGSS